MAICNKQQRKKTQVCVGSMNRRIDLLARALTPPVDPFTGQFVSTETFTTIATPWAMVATPKGVTIFDGVGIERVVTHIFTIRFLLDITSQNWVVYKGQRYDILLVNDFQENNLFLELNCALTGDETKEAAKA